MSTHHRQKRGRRGGPARRPPGLVSGLAEQPGQPLPSPRVSMSFNAQPGNPFAPPSSFRPGAHTRQESSFQSHAFPLPGMYPWSTPPVPSTPVKPGQLGNPGTASASVSPTKAVPPPPPSPDKGFFTRGSVHQRSPPTHSQELPTKRQRYRQAENGIGLGRPARLSVSVAASQARAARSATAPGGSAVPVRQPFGPANPLADGPAPFATGARGTWTFDPSARATLGHFPHSSLSLPLSGQPLPRHGGRQSVSNPSGTFFGARKAHPPHLSRSHERTPSIPHRVGPPPKAILGGPGGKTFEELRVPSPTRPTPAPSSPIAAASAAVTRPASPSDPSAELSSSPTKPTAKEPFEIKLQGGTTVRVALPPDVYDPPDTPSENSTEDPKKEDPSEQAEDKESADLGEGDEAKNEKRESGVDGEPAEAQGHDHDSAADGEAAEAKSGDNVEQSASVQAGEKRSKPTKTPRREAFPWPERRVASPKSIPLPPSPLEEDLEVSDVESLVVHDTPHGSVDITSSWKGKAIKVSMPQDSWEAMKAKTMSPGSTEPSALYEDALDQVELTLDEEVAEEADAGTNNEYITEPIEPGTARSLPIHLRSPSSHSNDTATGSDTAESRGMPQRRRRTTLSLSGNPFLQRSLGDLLRGDDRDHRSAAPSPVSAAFPQRGELPDWYHDPTMHSTFSPGQSVFADTQGFSQHVHSFSQQMPGFSQQGYLPDWPSDMLPRNEDIGEREHAAEAEVSEEGEGWGTPQSPQSTPGKEHGHSRRHSATKTDTEISESLWPSSSASEVESQSTTSTVEDIVVSVQVSTSPAKEASSNSDDRTVTGERGATKLDSDAPSSDSAVRERPRPRIATGFLQRQLQSIMRSDRPKAKPASPAPEVAPVTTTSDPDPVVGPTPEQSAGSEHDPDEAVGEAEETGDTQAPSSEGTGGGEESDGSDGRNAEDSFVGSPSSPSKQSSISVDKQDSRGDDQPTPPDTIPKSLPSPTKLKPDASVFVPKGLVASPTRMTFDEEASQSEQRPPVITSSVFTFGYPSTVERKLPPTSSSPRSPAKGPAALPALQPWAPSFQPSSSTFQPGASTFQPTAPAFQPTAPVFQPTAPVFHPSATAFQPNAPAFHPAAPALQPSAPAFQPNAPAFQPGSATHTFGSASGSQSGSGKGGALGLFTFTHNLRPTAAEFRPNGMRSASAPQRPHGSPRPHPPQLDLSKADPTSKPFELGSAFFPSNEGKVDHGNGEVSLLLREKRPIKIERPEPPAPLPQTHRDPASSRQHGERERTFVEAEEAVSDEDRESPRRRKHTAKRSSQNSYLPKASVFPKTPGSPEKKGEDVNIYPSQPVKDPAARPPGGTPSGPTHQKRPSLNPTAKPFVFGQSSYSSLASSQPQDPNSFSGASKRAAGSGVQVADASRFRTWVFPTSASNASTAAKSNHKRRHSESEESVRSSEAYNDRSPAASMHGLDTAAVEAMQRDIDEVHWSEWPGSLPRHMQPDQTGESVEFPMRRDSGQAIEVIKPTNDSSSDHSPLSTPSDIAIEHGLAAEILDKLESIEHQLASVKIEHERVVEEAFDRVNDSHESNAVRALNALRENLPTSTKALENVAAVLTSHSKLLREIQDAVNESLVHDDHSSHGSTRASDAQEGDTTLVNNTNAVIQELLKALQASQEEMLEKIKLSTPGPAIAELREVKEALLEVQAREAKADDTKDKEIAELKLSLKEERSRRDLADSKVAVLRSQVDTLKKRHDPNDEAWRSSLMNEVTGTTTLIKSIQTSETEAQQELVHVRAELSKQTELLQAMQAERDAANEIAQQRHEDATLLQKEMASFHSSFFERLDNLTALSGDSKNVKSLEAELAATHKELRACKDEVCELRVQLAEARASIELEREKGLRAGEKHATDARTLDLQLKAEKARGAFLDSKVQKAEAELAAVTQNLDVWRSAALEQRLRAEQSAVHIAAMQQENFHWREFALGADRHRLEQWLSSRPFEGLDHLTTPNNPASKAAPSVISSDAATPRAPLKAALAPPLPAKSAPAIEHPPPVPPKATPKIAPKIVEPAA